RPRSSPRSRPPRPSSPRRRAGRRTPSPPNSYSLGAPPSGLGRPRLFGAETPADATSAVPEDDAAAGQVVRREFDTHPVAGKDPDPVPPHLPRGVAEGLVVVVELDPEHAAPERLDDLAFELDLLFLAGYADLLRL